VFQSHTMVGVPRCHAGRAVYFVVMDGSSDFFRVE
jgi:hypothetical protein